MLLVVCLGPTLEQSQVPFEAVLQGLKQERCKGWNRSDVLPRRMRDHCWTQGGQLRFYCGAPLIAANNHRIGTLCARAHFQVPGPISSWQRASDIPSWCMVKVQVVPGAGHMCSTWTYPLLLPR